MLNDQETPWDWLCRSGNLPYAVVLSFHREYGFEAGTRVEIAVYMNLARLTEQRRKPPVCPVGRGIIGMA